MLFHLKEPDYETEAPNDIPTRFYARNPQHILNTIEYYRKREKLIGNEPNLLYWLKKRFTLNDIEETKEGLFIFFTGMIYLGDEDKDKPLFEELKITDDFRVDVPEENIGYFALFREQIPRCKREDLYKLQCTSSLFPNQSFVPEDIAKAIMSFDLTPYTGAVQKDMERRREISKHPNIKVDGLERVLRARSKNVQNR